MKIKINEGFLGLKDNYLFSEVARRVRDYGSANPEEEKRLIRLGIGDVTLPLAPCVVAAARRAKADYLVTNDERLLRHSPVAALSPRDMLALLRSLAESRRVV